MRWLCIFRQCRWQHVADVVHPDPLAVGSYGLWQCTRCKTLSMGRTE
jgi:hypothetical protein